MSVTTISQTTLRRVNRWKLFALIALLISAFIILVTIENLLVSSLVAFVISYTLGPVVNYLERQGISRGLATALVFFVVGSVLVLAALVVSPHLAQTLSGLQADMPRYISGLGQYVADIENRIHAYPGPFHDLALTAKMEMRMTDWTRDFFDQLPYMIKTFVTVMVLGPFLAFFMVKDGRSVMTNLLALVPNHLFEHALSLQHQINFQIGQFVRARIIESFIVGLVTTIGLLMIQFPYAILLGVFAGLTNFIPYIGPIFGAIPAVLIALVNGYSGLEVFGVALVYITAQAIDAGFLIPVFVAKIVDLHPVTVILVVIAGSQFLGVLGMIISIPVATTIKVTASTIYGYLIDTRS